jgi:hypothetical protein
VHCVVHCRRRHQKDDSDDLGPLGGFHCRELTKLYQIYDNVSL